MGNIQIQFNMKRFFFDNFEVGTLRIFPNDGFYLKFDKDERRWYTKDTIDEEPRAAIGSAVVPYIELYSADVTGQENVKIPSNSISLKVWK